MMGCFTFQNRDALTVGRGESNGPDIGKSVLQSSVCGELDGRFVPCCRVGRSPFLSMQVAFVDVTD